MINFNDYIGKRFIVKGFNEPRELEICEGYFLGKSKKYPAFRCMIISNTKYFKPSSRENFLYKDIIRAGQLVKEIKVLSA